MQSEGEQDIEAGTRIKTGGKERTRKPEENMKR
jgi:hypothetical protein